MPAKQAGEVFKRGASWQARWYDPDGNRKQKGGFATKTEARAHVNAEVERVKGVRTGKIAPAAERHATVDELIDGFLERHGPNVDPSTLKTLTTRLRIARATFGDRAPDSLRRIELEDWRATITPGSRPDVFRTFRQVLSWSVARGLLDSDASVGIKNPKRKTDERKDVHPFETWTDVDAIAEELDARYRAIPIVLVGTGLRPEELFGLHRADIDKDAKVLHVRRRFTEGLLKPGGKTRGSVRVVPLRQRVLDALATLPPRIDTPILFPAPRGGYIDLGKFRYREWTPALRAAGIAHRRVYDCRHTFATWAIQDGIPTLTLAKIMGTSVGQLEDTYVRWLKGDADNLRAIFDAADAKTA